MPTRGTGQSVKKGSETSQTQKDGAYTEDSASTSISRKFLQRAPNAVHNVRIPGRPPISLSLFLYLSLSLSPLHTHTHTHTFEYICTFGFPSITKTCRGNETTTKEGTDRKRRTKRRTQRKEEERTVDWRRRERERERCRDRRIRL